MAVSAARKAELYRMVTPEHTCPWGLKALDLLKREGFEIEDHHLKSRAETDTFKTKHQVETTPQTFIDGRRIGGYDDLREFLGKDVKDKARSPTSPSWPFSAWRSRWLSRRAGQPTEPWQRLPQPNGSWPSRCVCSRSRN